MAKRLITKITDFQDLDKDQLNKQAMRALYDEHSEDIVRKIFQDPCFKADTLSDTQLRRLLNNIRDNEKLWKVFTSRFPLHIERSEEKEEVKFTPMAFVITGAAFASCSALAYHLLK